MRTINKVSVARELPKVNSGLSEADRKLDQARRKAEHYGTEAFALGARQGQLVPYVTPQGSDYARRLAGIADLEFMSELEELASDLPTTFGSRLLKVSDIEVGLVSGPTITDLLEGTANIQHLGPWASDDSLESVRVLVVGMPVVDRDTAWSKAELEQIKTDLFPRARQLHLPIVVITTSDPMRTNATRYLAETADVLITTDPDGTDFYGKTIPDSVTIKSINACFNPMFYSPAGRERHRVNATLLAGKLPGTEQRQRFQAMRGLLTGLKRENEKIVASQGGVVAGLDESKTGLFPSEFADCLTKDPQPSLRSRVLRLMDLHVMTHLHPASSFAHPQETLEVLASGGAALSTYSVGINNDYPHVLLPDGPDDAQLQIRLLRSDAEHLRDLQMEGIRRSFATRTSDRLMKGILNAVGLPCEEQRIRVTWRGQDDGSDVNTWRNQVIPEDVEVQRISSNEPVPPDTHIVIDVPVNISARHHLVQDVVNAFRMASVDTVIIDGGAESSNEFEIIRKARINDRTVVAKWHGGGAPQFEDSFLMDGTSLRTKAARWDKEPELSVIVPVYNNGPYLLRKCLESLRRSTAFERMEIILVDDGSTKDETRRIVEEIADMWPNVRTFLFPQGGSGSASRPRNHGLNMVRTPWVTYLDPDNESVGDGYAELLEICRQADVDFAIGDMLRYAKTRTLTRNVGILRSIVQTDENGIGEVPDDALQRINFQPMSIQALVADTQWLKSLDLEQPVGALGQDSMFFQQMLQGARRIALLDKPIHTYYGEVAGSVVNTVSPSFFRKYVPLEEARSEWLKRDGLFHDYVAKRMERYVSVWFLPMYNNAVRREDKDECFELLDQLCSMYDLPLIRSEDVQKVELL